jgi:hypothetical protein
MLGELAAFSALLPDIFFKTDPAHLYYELLLMGL